MSRRCFACSRVLTNEKSVELGIGPVCRAKRKAEQKREEEREKELSKCHQGFNCYNPRHIRTVLGRLRNQCETVWNWALEESKNLRYVREEIEQEINTITNALGLDLPEVEAPELNATNRIEAISRLREMKVCPHGLQCRDPKLAVAATYRILSLLRFEAEPLFWHTPHGGLANFDSRAYEFCADVLSLLGLDDEATWIREKDIPKLVKRGQKRARRFERALQKRERRALARAV